MRRALFFILAGILLLAVIILLPTKRSPFGKSNSSFSITDTERITSIQISSQENSLILRKENGLWLLNSSSEARSSAISFILTTLHEIQIKSPVSEDRFESLVQDSNFEPVTVSVRGKGVRENFLIYHTGDTVIPYVFKKSEKTLPFILNIPGYEIDPGSLFIADNNFWLPYNIFNINPDDIVRVDLRYKDPEQEDITIELNDSISLSVSNIRITNPDMERIKRYLSYFTFIPFETWATGMDPDVKSSIINSVPEIEIDLQVGDSGEIELNLWIKYNKTEKGIQADTDRLYGELNNSGELFIVKYFDIDPLIKSSEYFIKR